MAAAQERLFEQSDAYRVHVCETCGMIAVANLRKNQFYCPACKNTTGIVQVFLPYACKLLFQVRATLTYIAASISADLVLMFACAPRCPSACEMLTACCGCRRS